MVASPGFDGTHKKGYERILNALRPLDVEFQRSFVHDKELLERLAGEGSHGVQAHWDTFREVAFAGFAARARLGRKQKDEPSDEALSKVDEALSKVELHWSLLQAAAEEVRGIIATSGKNPHYVLLEEGTMMVLSAEEPKPGQERSLSVISPTADEPLFVQRYKTSELSAEDVASISHALESFLENSKLEDPPQWYWYHSPEEMKRHKEQLARQFGRASTKAPSEEQGASEPEPTRLDPFLKSVERSKTSLENGSGYGNEEL